MNPPAPVTRMRVRINPPPAQGTGPPYHPAECSSRRDVLRAQRSDLPTQYRELGRLSDQGLDACGFSDVEDIACGLLVRGRKLRRQSPCQRLVTARGEPIADYSLVQLPLIESVPGAAAIVFDHHRQQR